MAGAFVDGALKGFEMMERHQARKDNKARLADLDERNDQRYQDSLDRQSRLDEERKDNREQDVTYRKDQAKATADYRKSTLEANQLQRQWQQNYQTQQAQWQNDQPVISLAWQSFRQTGRIPDDLSDVLSRNKGMDPRTYLKQEYRESVKGLNQTLDEVVKTGDLKLANNPTTVKLFNDVFGDKIQSSVGQYDPELKATIDDVKFGGFVPTEMKDGSVALLLNVTYKNDKGETFTEQKPMTKGRTSEGDDPVMTYSPKELIGTIKTRAMMADMMERPEYWDKMGDQVAANFGRKSAQQKEAPQEAEYRNHYLDLTKRREEALSDINAVDNYGMPLHPDKEARKKQIEAEFNNLKSELDGVFGKNGEATNKGKGSVKYVSKIDGIDAQSVIAKFMEANKNLTEQQATQIAIQQGYLSNGQ